MNAHLCGVIGRIPAFKPSGLSSIPGEVKNFNSDPETRCVSFVFCPVLSLTVALTNLCICLVFWSKICIPL